MKTRLASLFGAVLLSSLFAVAVQAQNADGTVSLFLETFDSGDATTDAAPVPLADLGWSLHHSFVGAYMNEREIGGERGVYDVNTSSELGDPQKGQPHGYASIFVDKFEEYGPGEEGARPDLPGPHPETGEYYSNRTLAVLLWKEHALSAAERERITSFNFVQGNRNASKHSFMPAVRIDGSWYVYLVDQETLGSEVRILGRPAGSEAEFNGAENVFHGDQFTMDGGFPNSYNAQPYHFAWSETGWTPLTFDGSMGTDSTVGMRLGDPMDLPEGALPAGAIEAVGVYSPENIEDPYGGNGHRIDSIEIVGAAPPPQDLFTYTFNNEGQVEGSDRPIQAGNWDGIYSSEALPLVTGEAVMADLSEGVSQDDTPGHYKAGFLFVTGLNDQPAPEAFLVYSTNTNVVSTVQNPASGNNPQTDWFSEAPNPVTDLGELSVLDLGEMGLRIRPRNADAVDFHFAIQAGGEWYISVESFQHSGESGDWEGVTFDAATADWYTGVVGADSLVVDFETEAPETVSTADIGDVLLETVGIYINTGDFTGTSDTWARVDHITLSATVPAAAPPEIVDHPVDLTVNEGESATFSVTATDEGDLTYQWRKGGVEIAGATEAELVLDNILLEDAGSYDVVVTGAGGAAISDAATLTVVEAPNAFPLDFEVPAEASNQMVTVEAASGVAWTAESNADWITISYGGGSGSDIVLFDVAANPDFSPRTGTLTVAGLTVTVEQAASIPTTFEGKVGATQNADGSYSSDWFGDFEIGENDFIDHYLIGELYVGDIETIDDMLFYSVALEAWIWSDVDLFPVLYDYTREAYVLLLTNPGGRVVLYNFATMGWEVL